MSDAHQMFEEMGFDSSRAQIPDAVVYAIARTFNLLSRELSTVYRRFSLSAPSFNLLMLLKHGKDAASFTQQEVGRRLVVSPSDMTGLIDRLEHKGLVRRNPGRDRRCHLLAITQKGSRMLDEVWPHHVEAIQLHVGSMTDGEAKVLLRVLAQIRVRLTG